MRRTLPPILFLPTLELRGVLGAGARAAAACAFREILLAAKGLEIEHLQFEFRDLTLAVCSRVRGDGRLVIEAGLGDPNLPRRCFAAVEARRAAQQAAAARRFEMRGSGWTCDRGRRALR